jgi:hypothetical protein
MSRASVTGEERRRAVIAFIEKADSERDKRRRNWFLEAEGL